jgi:oligopeptide transport system substrate-binding protein
MTTTPRLHWWISLALLPLGGLMAMVFLGPRQSLPVRPRPSDETDVLRVAYAQKLLPDPHQRTFPVSAHNHFILCLWEPLVECDPATGEPRPAAAASWSWSPDRLALTLKLRADARWSNGDAVTAQDFVRGWRRLLRQRMDVAQTLFPLKNAEAFHRQTLQDPEQVGVRAIDPLTLRLDLAQVRSTMVAELADPLLAPLHRGGAQALAGNAYVDDPESLVTNGPFRLREANGTGYRLQASPYYHGRAEVRLAGVRFIRANASVAPLLLAAGVVDVVSPALGEERPLPTSRPVRKETELVLAVSSIAFNVTRGPLRDVRVRQALALALDRAGPVARFNPGRMTPAWSWVPDMPGRAGLVLLREDAAEARRLLAEAGYPAGQGFPILEMPLPLWAKTDPYPADWTERWYQELGVRTHIIYEPAAVQAKRMTPTGDYDVLYGNLIATVPDAGDLLSGFLWPAEYSETKWSDQEFARFMHEANRKTGADRLRLLEKAERLAMEAVPAVPMMFEQRQALLAAEVQGWYADPLARQSLKRLRLEATVGMNSNPGPRL